MLLALTLLAPAPLLLAAALPPAAAPQQDEIFLAVSTEAMPDADLYVYVDSKGRVEIDGQVRLVPGGKTGALSDWLSRRIEDMPTRRNPDLNLELPDERVLLLVDARAPFRSVQKVMGACARADVLLWKLELAVLLTDDRGSGVIPIHLPTGMDVPEEVEEGAPPPPASRQPITVRIDVLDAGAPPEAQRARPDDADSAPPEGRALAFRVGPRVIKSVPELAKLLDGLDSSTLLTIDPRKGVIQRDVVAVLDAARGAGFRSFAFVGSFD